MKKIIGQIKPRYFFYFLAGVFIFFAAFNLTSQFNPFAALSFNSNNHPLRPIEEFVLFATDKVELSQDIQSLRGNIGSNEEIRILERSRINGDLFSNQIRLAEEVIINGNTLSKILRLDPTAKILGVSSTGISFPVAKIPEIPSFTHGEQDLKIPANQEITLSPGNFRDLEIGENSRITFQPGIYNLRALKAGQNSRLILENGAVFNIAESLNIENDVSLFSKNNQIKPENILFQTPANSAINIGQNTNLTFRLIAPNANVQISQDSLIRGNIWARDIIVGEETVITRTTSFAIPSNPQDIIQIGDLRVFVNSINVNFIDAATFEDAERIAQIINAKISSFGPTTNTYEFEILTRTKAELDAAVNQLRSLNDPKIEGVFRSYPFKLPFVP